MLHFGDILLEATMYEDCICQTFEQYLWHHKCLEAESDIENGPVHNYLLSRLPHLQTLTTGDHFALNSIACIPPFLYQISDKKYVSTVIVSARL